MEKNNIQGSAFPSLSQAIITGGKFVSHNTYNTYSHSPAKPGFDSRLLPAVAPNALHNSGHAFDLPKCHPGTRVAVIQALLDWANGEQEEIREKDIAWLSGPAGSGKSAIGRTLCEHCAADSEESKGAFAALRIVVASFFFSSADQTRNHSRSLVPTIAYQICSISPAVRNAVSAFVDYDPLIFTRSLRTQLSSLVVDPLHAVYATEPQKAPRFLIVIDGLDECLDKDSQRDILESLLHTINMSRARGITIRILVCSRPETQISNSFDAPSMRPAVFRIFLGNEYSPDDDIKLYLHDRFAHIRASHNLKSLIPELWPAKEVVDQIVHKACGQFIFATTVMRYVESSRHRPHHRLESALGYRPPFKDFPFAELDALYTHIIMMADEPNVAIDILAYPALYGGIDAAYIERFLELEAGDVQVVLTDLSAIVDFQMEEYYGPFYIYLVNLHHKSFPDFLFDSQRSGQFYRNRTDTTARHILRAIQVFSEELKGQQFLSNDEIYVSILTADEAPYQDWKNSDQANFLDAVAHFPLDSYFRTLGLPCDEKGPFQHPSFLPSLLRLLFRCNKHPEVKGLLHERIKTACECMISELLTQYSDNLKNNYIFARTYIANTPRHLLRYNVEIYPFFARMLEQLAFEGPAGAITQTVLILLTNGEKSTILAKAALHCLQELQQRRFEIIPEAKRHLQLSSIALRKRRTHPWRWHMRPGSHVFEGKPVLGDDRRLRIITYEDLTSKQSSVNPDQIYSFECFDWVLRKSSFSATGNVGGLFTFGWSTYIKFLENLCIYLPLAARYAPLIQLCRTKSFAPMSMMFPTLSRRARRKIAQYLERMESGDNRE